MYLYFKYTLQITDHLLLQFMLLLLCNILHLFNALCDDSWALLHNRYRPYRRRRHREQVDILIYGCLVLALVFLNFKVK